MEPKIPTFTYTGGDLEVTNDMMTAWNEQGIFLIKKLFNDEEVKRLLYSLEKTSLKDSAYDLPDGKGRAARLLLWGHPGDDVTGMVARCEKVVNTCEKLLGGEVYHYHTKIIMKEARFGGGLLWHQDYGYWYKNGNLTPDLLTVYIPLDKCCKENGCIQVCPGSHRCGRIDHVMQAGQHTADPERVAHVVKRFPLVYAEGEPGDAFFFHCNILHKSDDNDSNMRRWAFLSSFNSAKNNPVKKHHHPQYTPIQKVPNDAILRCTNVEDFSGKDILDPSIDETVKAEKIKDTEKY